MDNVIYLLSYFILHNIYCTILNMMTNFHDLNLVIFTQNMKVKYNNHFMHASCRKSHSECSICSKPTITSMNLESRIQTRRSPLPRIVILY